MANQPGERGFDAGKKIMGRKRHILVDTLGLIPGVRVHAASIQDRDGAKLLAPWLILFGCLSTVFVDGGYAGALAQWFRDLLRKRNLKMEVVKSPRDASGFVLLPMTWVVERTFVRLSNFRRPSKAHEVKTDPETHSQTTTFC